jgi:hypothetical protein
MTELLKKKDLITNLIQPETALERIILQDKSFQEGLLWGKPRRGHPEGKIIYHIREVLDNVEKVIEDDVMRQQLRLITIIHDTFKFQEDTSYPRDWDKHHALIARNFAEHFIDDDTILDIIELHDEAYYCWRWENKYFKPEIAKRRKQNLLDRIGVENMQLYYLFFKCDTQTGDKTQEPVAWFEKTFDVDVVKF